MGDIKARAKDVVKYEAFGDAGGVIEELVSQLEKAEAERDAAVAAVERVRANHQIDDYTAGHTIVRCVCEEIWPCSTIQALDGAPEPEAVEWEYEYADDDDPEGNVYGQFRRVVGPWLPVEGESK